MKQMNSLKIDNDPTRVALIFELGLDGSWIGKTLTQ